MSAHSWEKDILWYKGSSAAEGTGGLKLNDWKHPYPQASLKARFLTELSSYNLKTTTSAALAFCLGILILLLCGISSKRAFLLTAAVFQIPAVEMMVIILGFLRSKVIHPGWPSIARDTSCTPLPPFGSGCLSPGRVYMCCCNLGLSSSLGKAVFL